MNMNIKIGTPISIINFSKTYKFVDQKGRPIIPTSYKSLTKHFDNLEVIDIYQDESGQEFIKAKMIANSLYVISNIELTDIELLESHYVINTITGEIEIVKDIPYMTQLLGLVFESEEDALKFIENKEKENQN